MLTQEPNPLAPFPTREGGIPLPFSPRPGERRGRGIREVLMPRNIVIGQKVASEKVRRARELRSGQTAAEDVLWQALRANQLDSAHFRRQQVIRGFIVDFYCHCAALVIEIDGPVHQGQAQQDAEREKILRENDLRIIRFTNQQVLDDLPSVLLAIRRTLETTAEGEP